MAEGEGAQVQEPWRILIEYNPHTGELKMKVTPAEVLKSRFRMYGMLEIARELVVADGVGRKLREGNPLRPSTN